MIALATAMLGLAASSGAPAVGDALAPFELRTLEGRPFRWAPGRTTVLSFCAFWCDTWKDQLPRVGEALKTTKGLPVDFATVSVDGRWTERGKTAAVGTMLGDPGGAWTDRLGIDRVPYTLVVAPSGTIVWAAYGTVRTPSLVDAVRQTVAARRESAGRIFLTFDDFPADRQSEELLDALRAAEVKATLFCIGAKAAAAPGLMARAAREGHALAIHSWAHDGDRPELERCVAAIRETSGQTAEWYRPPGSERILDLKGQPLSLPVDDPYDYTRPGLEELVRRVLLYAKPNAVVQLHAGVEETVRAIPTIVAKLRARGYAFETVARP